MGRYLAMLAAITACGGSTSSGGDDGGGGGGGDGPITMPPSTCTVPPEGMLVDTSASTNVVGDGTAGSCTAAALQAAVDMGGLVRFDCGPSPVVISLTQPIKINNVAGADHLGDTVIDGGGMVTLSGNFASRLIYLDACSPPYNSPNCDTFPHPHLTVERLDFIQGGDQSPDGGAAIFRKGGALTVIDSLFADNRCATTGQDTAGGALRLIYPTPTLVVGSNFTGNQCSNGGAIGSLGASPVTIVNSTIRQNSATGTGGNPGNGGNGGAIYHDGAAIDLELCGVALYLNTGNAYGGGLFFVSNTGQGTVGITNSTISENSIPYNGGMPNHSGAGYIQGADVTIANAMVFGNAAAFAAGLYVNSMNGRGSLNATNLTMTSNAGDGLTLEGGVHGTLLNCTIAVNRHGITGAAPMTLANTIVSGNQQGDCDVAPMLVGGNFGCGGSAADPQLGPSADNGGTTGVYTMAPAATSPAAGAGTAMCPSTDARGMPRPMTGCTSGAHQL